MTRWTFCLCMSHPVHVFASAVTANAVCFLLAALYWLLNHVLLVTTLPLCCVAAGHGMPSVKSFKRALLNVLSLQRCHHFLVTISTVKNMRSLPVSGLVA